MYVATMSIGKLRSWIRLPALVQMSSSGNYEGLATMQQLECDMLIMNEM